MTHMYYSTKRGFASFFSEALFSIDLRSGFTAYRCFPGSDAKFVVSSTIKLHGICGSWLFQRSWGAFLSLHMECCRVYHNFASEPFFVPLILDPPHTTVVQGS